VAGKNSKGKNNKKGQRVNRPEQTAHEENVESAPRKPVKSAPVDPRELEKRAGINWMESGQLGLVVLVIILVALFATKPLGTRMQRQLGLDLQGGVHVVYQAAPTPEAPLTSDSITKLIAIFSNRVDSMGVSEPQIQSVGSNRVSVDLPGVKDPEAAVEQIGRTANLTFKTEDGKTVLTGKYLQDAKAQLDQSNKPEVSLTFNSDGAKIFAQVSTANVGKRIGIYLDGKLLTNPTVNNAILNGDASISGGYKSLQEAQNEAVLLRSGALPVNVNIVEKRTVGPTLGKDSLDRSVTAGIIGLAFIFLFMLIYYRVPGIVADLSLVVYTLIVAGLFILINATLTLPGIAGFILSIGMAVDANILIYERIKEELRAGKTLRASFDAGFKHALRTILDCNMNTLIACAVLYYFGSGPIRGFAVTLSIGVLTSLFTAVTFTRFVLHLLARSRLVLNHRAYGVLGGR
jgi:preprotein translocase subunit SecD